LWGGLKRAVLGSDPQNNSNCIYNISIKRNYSRVDGQHGMTPVSFHKAETSEKTKTLINTDDTNLNHHCLLKLRTG